MKTKKEGNLNGYLITIFSKISNLGYLPRWIVFFIDVAILGSANLIKHFVMLNLTSFAYDTVSVGQRYAIVIGINIIFFLVFRTYSGIVRHSTFIDGVRLLMAVVASFCTLLTINYTTFFFIGKKIFLIPGLFISHLITYILLFLVRIFVKFFFESFSTDKSKRSAMQRVLIYGTDANALSVASALKTDVDSKFMVLGFVSENNNYSSKLMFGLPILTLSRKLPVILRSMSADGLIIVDKGLSNEAQIRIVDECLEYDFKVYAVPSVVNWEDKKAISQKIHNIRIEDLLDRKPIVLDKSSISSQLAKKTILVTGAAGSIGSEIARQVLSFNPYRLILLDQAETPLHQLGLEIDNLEVITEVIYVIADIRDRNSIEKVYETYHPEVVYHAAAYKHVPLMEENPSQAVHTNVAGTKNLADLACKYGVKKFVMVSTDKAVNPSNVMGASKRIAEKYVQTLQYQCHQQGMITKFITTRFGNVLGSNGSVVPLFTKQIEAGGPVTITHPEIIRYFMTIPEACQLVLEAGAMGNGGEIYIFDMGKPVKIIDLAHKMIKLAGFVPEKDIKIQVTGLRPGEKLYEELLNDASKTLPTHHEKIMIAKEIYEDFDVMYDSINGLVNNIVVYENKAIVSKMKSIVPEFVSKNSLYEVLDAVN